MYQRFPYRKGIFWLGGTLVNINNRTPVNIKKNLEWSEVLHKHMYHVTVSDNLGFMWFVWIRIPLKVFEHTCWFYRGKKCLCFEFIIDLPIFVRTPPPPGLFQLYRTGVIVLSVNFMYIHKVLVVGKFKQIKAFYREMSFN